MSTAGGARMHAKRFSLRSADDNNGAEVSDDAKSGSDPVKTLDVCVDDLFKVRDRPAAPGSPGRLRSLGWECLRSRVEHGRRQGAATTTMVHQNCLARAPADRASEPWPQRAVA